MVDVNVDFIIEPDVTYTADILLSSASSFHNELFNRDLPDQHPMSAITGLEDALEGLSDDITAENNRAIEAEEALDDKIDLEETRAKGVEQDLASSIDSNHQAISDHVSDKNNPHEVTKAQVGLGNVANLAPADMPMSTATKTYVDNADTVLQGQINTINTTIGGYGNIVTHNVSEFATASQGALADTALQPNDNISELTNNLNYQTATQVANSIAVETSNRENADINLQSQIDAIVSASDVFDIVGTYAELQAYDISTVPVNDIIKVLVDSTHAGAATYYRCVENNNVKSWSYIGSEGAYYTKAEADSNFVPQTRTVNNKALSNDITLTANDVGALPSSTSIPTATSDLVNDSGFITSSALTGYATETYVDTGLATKQNTLTADNAGTGISIENGVISNTQTSAEWGNIEGDITDQTDLIELLDTKQDKLTSDNAGTDIEIVNGAGGDDTVSGNGFILLEKAVADGLNSVTISGGCEQTATPSPTNPIPIVSNNGELKVDNQGQIYTDGTQETVTDGNGNTATAEMLLSIGNYTDTQEILTGAVTRKVGVKVFDGTENWELHNNISNTYRLDDVFTDLAQGVPILQSAYCTHFNITNLLATNDFTQGLFRWAAVSVGTVVTVTSGTRLYMCFGFGTVAEVKQYLAQQYANGTPVIIVYPLATETTETVTGQTLTTIQGDSTLTISQASIENLPIEANYNVQGGTVINFTGTIPTVNNATITFTQGGTTKGTITTNQSNNQTIALDAGGSGGGTWGSITGTLSDQTDLQNALNAKLNTSDLTEYTAQEVETLWGSI